MYFFWPHGQKYLGKKPLKFIFLFPTLQNKTKERDLIFSKGVVNGIRDVLERIERFAAGRESELDLG